MSTILGEVQLPDYQVLYHLKQVEQFGDLRKYCRCLDELIFLNNSGLPIPAAPSPATPVLTVVKAKSK